MGSGCSSTHRRHNNAPSSHQHSAHSTPSPSEMSYLTLKESRRIVLRAAYEDPELALAAARSHCEAFGHMCYTVAPHSSGDSSYVVQLQSARAPTESSSNNIGQKAVSAVNHAIQRVFSRARSHNTQPAGGRAAAPSSGDGLKKSLMRGSTLADGTCSSTRCLCLHRALYAGNTSEVQSLCRQPGAADLSLRTSYPLLLTPLHLAASSGDVELLNFLVAATPDAGVASAFCLKFGCPPQYKRSVTSHPFHVRRPNGIMDMGYTVSIPAHLKAMRVVPELLAKNAEEIKLYSVLDCAYLSGSAGMIWRVTTLLASFGLLTEKEKAQAIARLFRMRFLRTALANNAEHVPLLQSSAWAAAVAGLSLEAAVMAGTPSRELPVPWDSVWADSNRLFGTLFWMMESGASPSQCVLGTLGPQAHVTSVMAAGGVLYPRCRMPTMTPVCHAVFSGNAAAFTALVRAGCYRGVEDLDEATFLAHTGIYESIININQLLTHVTYGYLTQRTQTSYDRVIEKLGGLRQLVKCFVEVRKVAAAAGLLNPARASAQGRRWNTSPQVFSRCARRVQCWNFWWFDEQRELFGAGVVPSCVAAGLNCEGPIEALGRIMSDLRGEARPAYVEKDTLLRTFDEIADMLRVSADELAVDTNWGLRKSMIAARLVWSKQQHASQSIALLARAQVAPPTEVHLLTTPHRACSLSVTSLEEGIALQGDSSSVEASAAVSTLEGALFASPQLTDRSNPSPTDILPSPVSRRDKQCRQQLQQQQRPPRDLSAAPPLRHEHATAPSAPRAICAIPVASPRRVHVPPLIARLTTVAPPPSAASSVIDDVQVPESEAFTLAPSESGSATSGPTTASTTEQVTSPVRSSSTLFRSGLRLRLCFSGEHGTLSTAEQEAGLRSCKSQSEVAGASTTAEVDRGDEVDSMSVSAATTAAPTSTPSLQLTPAAEATTPLQASKATVPRNSRTALAAAAAERRTAVAASASAEVEASPLALSPSVPLFSSRRTARGTSAAPQVSVAVGPTNCLSTPLRMKSPRLFHRRQQQASHGAHSTASAAHSTASAVEQQSAAVGQTGGVVAPSAGVDAGAGTGLVASTRVSVSSDVGAGTGLVTTVTSRSSRSKRSALAASAAEHRAAAAAAVKPEDADAAAAMAMQMAEWTR